MPDPFILSPSGLVAHYNYNTYATPFAGSTMAPSPYLAVPPLAGVGNKIARTIGQHTVSTTSGSQGIIQVSLTVGTAQSAPVCVAMLVDNPAAPVAVLGLAIDTFNRPTAYLTNASGTIVAQYTGSGSALAAGTVVAFQLIWNALVPLTGSQYVELETLYGVNEPGSWSTNPSVAWTPFTPTALLVGCGFTATHVTMDDLGTAGGSVALVQVSNSTTGSATLR